MFVPLIIQLTLLCLGPPFQHEITGAEASFFWVSTPSLVAVNEEFPITFWTNFTSYPDITCYWDFHDGFTSFTNATELQDGFTYSYFEAGAYTMWIDCMTVDLYDSYFSEVLVYSEISYEICAFRSVNLTYDYDIYVLGESNLLVFNHHQYPDPVYYYMELDGYPVFDQGFSYGSLSNNELYAVSLDSLPFSMELQYIIGLGPHNVSMTVYSELNGTAVYCEAEIKFVELISGLVFYVSAYVVETDTPFIGSATAETGWPALIEWQAVNNEDNTVEFFFDSIRQAWDLTEVDEVWLYISRPGNFTVTATIYHEINQASASTIVIVQNPVTTIDISTNSPLHFPFESTLEIEVNFTSADPTDVYRVFDYGDGWIEMFDPIKNEPDFGNFSLNHIYAQPGLYTLQLLLYNDVSSGFWQLPIAVLEDIGEVTIQSFSGESGNLTLMLPLEFPAKLAVQVSDGTVELYEWTINGSFINTTELNGMLEYKFPAEGDYEITVCASNFFSSNTTSVKVSVLQSITGIYIINDGPVLLQNKITLFLFLYQLGRDSVFTIDFGDGTHETLPAPTRQGNIAHFLPVDIDLPFNPEDYYSLVLNHTYTSAGMFSATAIAQNPVSRRQATCDVFLQERICLVPVLHIMDGGSTYDSVVHYHRSKRFQFSVDVSLQCQYAATVWYQWELYRLTEVFTVPAEENRYPLPPSIVTNLTTLYVPAFTLEYGSYVFRLDFTVILTDGLLGVNKQDQAYVSVVPTALFPYIFGGSSLATGWYNNITVDGSLSMDPDFPGNTDGLLYSWFCRGSNETYSSDDDLLLSMNGLAGTEGCLNEGFPMQSSSSSILHIPAQTLEGNRTYVFRLIVSKEGRGTAHADQTLTILPGHPPTILIRCLTNCGTFVNPSERLVLSAVCQDCTLQTRPRYYWSLIPASPNNTKQSLQWRHDTSTTATNPYVAIRGNTFGGSEEYILRVIIHSWSGASTFAEYGFITNSPPSMGTCSVAPIEGVALETQFSVLCDGFVDEDEPVSYAFWASSGAEQTSDFGHSQEEKGTLLYYGVDSHVPSTTLPFGLASRDYMVDIHVEVSDSYGASAYITVTAKVLEPTVDTSQPYATVTDTVLQLTSGEDNTLSGLVESGDAQHAAQLVYVLTALLNAEAESDTVQREEAPLEEWEEEKDFMEQKKSKRAEARESIINNIRQIEVRDMETLQQTSAAIAQATREKEEISAKAQLSAAESYQEMCSFLREQSDSGAGGETVEETASFIMAGLSNIMEAAFTTLTSVVNSTGESASPDHQTETEETIRNTRNVTTASLQALGKLQTAVLHGKVPGEEHTVIETEAVSLILQRQERWQLAASVRDSKAGQSFFEVPEEALSDGASGGDYDDIIDSHMHRYYHNPFAWASQNEDDVTGHVISLELEYGNGVDHSKLELRNLTKDIDIFIEQKTSNAQELQEIRSDSHGGHYYSFNVKPGVQFVIIELLWNASFMQEPIGELHLSLNDSFLSMNTSFPDIADVPVSAWNDSSNITGNPYMWIIPFSEIGVAGGFGLTIKSLSHINDSMLQVYAFGAQCIFWNDEDEEWDTTGCKVGPLTSHSLTHCQCNHLSHFAAGFVVLPNTVNFIKDASLFSQIVENPVTAATVGALLALYILFGVWAQRRDRQAKERARVIFLGDNNPEAQYKYHVTVFTGMRRGAGTTAVATLTLHGTAGSSDPHVLMTDEAARRGGKRKRQRRRPGRRILQRGGVDSFVLTTHSPLEELTAIRVWHDNSGKKPEWHINRILVHDLQTRQLWYFLCHSWLAVDLGEGLVDRTFPVASSEDLSQFQHLFITRVLRDMKDHHLWVSIFAQPQGSTFTRLQRVTCCFTLLMMSMLASIMFFGVTPEDAQAPAGSVAPDMSQEIGMGTIRVTWFDILVGVESGLLALPASIVILEIFRNVRPRETANDDKGSVEIVDASTSRSYDSKQQQEVRSPSEGPLSRESDEPHILLASTHAADSSLGSDACDSMGDSNAMCDPHSSMIPGRSGAASGNVISESTDLSLSDVIVDTMDDDTKPHLCCWGLCQRDHKGLCCTKDRLSTISEQVDSMPSSDQDSQSNTATTGEGTEGGPQNAPPFFMRHQDYLHHHINKMYEELYTAPEGYFSTKEDQQKALLKLEEVLRVNGWYQFHPDSAKKDTPHREDNEMDDDADDDDDVRGCCRRDGKGCLPWWFVYVGWSLVVAINLICGYLIMLYGLSYGRQASVDWLVSVLVSLTQSVFVLQPAKVILVAAFFAIVWKKHEDDDVGLEFFTDKTGVFMDPAYRRTRRAEGISRYYQPPLVQSVNQARARRQAEAKMCGMLKELLGQVLLVVLALEVAHLQRDPQGFLLHQALEDTFTAGFEDVSSMNDVYAYLEESFVPELYGERYGFLGDERTFRLGRARLRQVRIKPDSCTVPYPTNTVTNCTGTLRSPGNTDRQPYNLSWSVALPEDLLATNQESRWVFTNQSLAQGSYLLGSQGLYTRGGYIQQFGATARSSLIALGELRDGKWLDQLTRALYVEWTVFHVDTSLLCVCTVLFEATPFGVVAASSQFHTFTLFSTITFIDKVNLALQSVYLLVILVLIRLEVKKFRRKGKDYFHFWNCLNLITIVLSIMAAVVYCLWAQSLAIAMSEYKQDPAKFTSFYLAVILDVVFAGTSGVLVFVNTLRCAKILRFNSSIQTVNNTFACISSAFIIFTLTLLIFISSFAILFCVAFGSDVMDFKDLSFSFQTIFLFLEGGYEEFTDVSDLHPNLGAFYFILMTFVLLFLLFNFYILLILYSFRDARRMEPEINSKDIVAAIVDWVFSVLSIKTKHTETVSSLPTDNFPLHELQKRTD